MPGLTGSTSKRWPTPGTGPLSFITGHGDIAMSVEAVKAGAVDFLRSPSPAKLLAPSSGLAKTRAIYAEARVRDLAAGQTAHAARDQVLRSW
jgi:FixJ family two-component response regulator